MRFTSLTAASLPVVCIVPLDFSVISPLSFVPFPFASRSVTVWSVPFAFLFSTLILPLTTGWMESSSLSALSSTETLPWMAAFPLAPCTARTLNWLPAPCKSTLLALVAVTFCARMPAVAFWVMPAFAEVSATFFPAVNVVFAACVRLPSAFRPMLPVAVRFPLLVSVPLARRFSTEISPVTFRLTATVSAPALSLMRTLPSMAGFSPLSVVMPSTVMLLN